MTVENMVLDTFDALNVFAIRKMKEAISADKAIHYRYRPFYALIDGLMVPPGFSGQANQRTSLEGRQAAAPR